MKKKYEILFFLFLLVGCQRAKFARNPQSIKKNTEKVTADNLLKKLSSGPQSIRLIGALNNRFSRQKKTFLHMDFIKKNTIKLKGNDPNFKGVGIQEFEGVPLAAIIDYYSKKNTKEVTFIANDQYVSIEDKKFIKKSSLILAYKADGKPIPSVLGGPFKLIYDPRLKVHPPSYCWYVKTIVLGKIKKPSLVKVEFGKEKNILFRKIGPQFIEEKKVRLSIPIGNRKKRSFPSSDEKTEITRTKLINILSKRKISEITFSNFLGKKIKIPGKFKNEDIYIVHKVNGEQIPAINGGPFIMQIESSKKDFRKIIPDRVFYFLNKIEVK